MVSYADFKKLATPAPSDGGEESMSPIGSNGVSPFILAPWHDDAAAEAQIKKETSFTIRCFPVQVGPADAEGGVEASTPSSFAPLAVPSGSACFFSGRPATHMALFARAY